MRAVLALLLASQLVACTKAKLGPIVGLTAGGGTMVLGLVVAQEEESGGGCLDGPGCVAYPDANVLAGMTLVVLGGTFVVATLVAAAIEASQASDASAAPSNDE